MTLKLRRWVARKELGDMRSRYEAESANRAAQAFQVGHCQGHFQGQQSMIDQLERIVAERHEVFPEADAEDVARLRKGVLH